MSRESGIEWTDATWNPVVGCTRVSAGCENCYAERMAARLAGRASARDYHGTVKSTPRGPRWTGLVRLIESRLTEPLRWRKPKRIFVNSMSDLFHDSVSDEHAAAIFGVMALAPWHTFQVLTKRAQRMSRFASSSGVAASVFWAADRLACDHDLSEDHPSAPYLARGSAQALWPLPNVHLGVSVEDQETADQRLEHLTATPASVRFVSAEPLLGPIDFMGPYKAGWLPEITPDTADSDCRSGIDWIVVGGESGPRARPCDVEWIRSIVEQCAAARVACFVKQLGEHSVCGTLEHRSRITFHSRHGSDPKEWPTDLRVRQLVGPIGECRA